MRKALLFMLFLLSLLNGVIKAQVNMDTPSLSFEKGFQNWKLEEGTYRYDSIGNSYVYGDWKSVSSQTTRRFLILNNATTTLDTILLCSDLKTNPFGKPVARIGAPLKREGYFSGNVKAAAERLTYEFIVTPNSTLLTYKLAAVLNSPVGTNGDDHMGPERPSYRVDINVYEPTGIIASPAPSCSRVEILADTANHNLNRSPICNSSAAGGNAKNYVYQNWITGNINLSNYIGCKVIITIRNHDCLSTSGDKLHAGAHESYGYFWAETRKIALEAFSCSDSVATIKAPEGFTSYKWTRDDKLPIASTANEITIEKSLNIEGVTYTCEMDNTNSMCGSISASTKVNQVKINPGFSSVTLDAGKIQFTNTSTSSGDSITNYYWDFGDGKAGSLDKNPLHQYTEFKPFEVKLKVTTKNGCNQNYSQLVTPTRNLTAELIPTDTTLYNGRVKNYIASNLSITGLKQGQDYYLVYINQKDTTKKSLDAPSTVGDYIVRFELSPLVSYKYIMDTVPFKKFSITPAPLTITPNSYTKTYGQNLTLQASAFSTSINPLYGTDIISRLIVKCDGTDSHAQVLGSPYAITIDSVVGTGLSNYNIQLGSGKLNVEKKKIEIWPSNLSKIYGDTMNLTGQEFRIADNQLLTGDMIQSVELSSPGFNKLAKAGSDSIYIQKISGIRLDNYDIKYGRALLSIEKKTLNINTKSLTKIYGENYQFSNKDFSYDPTNLVGNDRIDSIQFNSDGAKASAYANMDYVVKPLNPFGNGLDNYDIKIQSGSMFVSRKPVTLTVLPASKVYGELKQFSGNEYSLEPSLLNNDNIQYVDIRSEGSEKTSQVGIYEITASSATGTGTSNYDFVYKKAELTVTKKTIVPVLTAPQLTTYNGVAKGVTTGIPEASELIEGIHFTIRYTSTNPAKSYNSTVTPVEAGSYMATFELDTVATKNHYVDQAVSLAYNISKAPLFIEPKNAEKYYGQNKLNYIWYHTQLYGNDKITDVQLHSTGEEITAQTGVYSIDSTGIAGEGLDNYTIRFKSASLLVKKATLILQAKNKNKVYGEIITPAANDFAIITGELLPGDYISTVNYNCSGFSFNAPVGIDSIKISDASGYRISNYNIIYTKGTLTISPKELTIQSDSQKKTYGDSFQFSGTEFTTSPAQLVGNDKIDRLGQKSEACFQSTKVGNYPIETSLDSISGTGLSNYKISFTQGNFVVEPKSITIRIDTVKKTYGIPYSFTGKEFNIAESLVGIDKVDALSLTSLGINATDMVSEQGYDITANAVSGTNTGNYIFRFVPGKLIVLKKEIKPELILPDNLQYDGTKKIVHVQGVDELKEVQDYTIRYVCETDSKKWNSTTAPTNVGKYISTFELSEMAASKYFITNTMVAQFEITKTALIISADKSSKIYGEKIQPASFTSKVSMNSLYANDYINSIRLKSQATSELTPIGLYDIELDTIIGSGLDNYAIGYLKATCSVERRPIELMANSMSKTYGDNIITTGKEFSLAANSQLVGSDKIEAATIQCEGFKANADAGADSISIKDAMGNGLNNYSIRYSKGALLIGKAALSLAPKKQSKVYGNSFIFNNNEYSINSGKLFNQDKVDSVKLSSIATEAKTAVGKYPISIKEIHGAGLDNYNITTTDSLFAITARPLSIQIDTLLKPYGEILLLKGTECKVTGVAPCDNIQSIKLESDGMFADAVVNSNGYAIRATEINGIVKQNYAITMKEGMLQVIQKELTASIVAPSNLIYNGTNKKFSAITNLPGLKEGIDYEIRYTSVPDESKWNSNVPPVAAGDYKAEFILSEISAQKYKLLNTVFSLFSISKATLDIKANNATKTYGTNLNQYDFSYQLINNCRFFANDTIFKIDYQSKGMADTTSVGSTTIKPVKAYGWGLDNYSLRYYEGTLNVLPKELQVKALDDTKTYGDNIVPTNNKFYVDTKYLIGTDAVTSVTLSSEGYARMSQIGNYKLEASDAKGIRLNNYSISYVAGNLHVVPKKISIAAKTISKVYGSEYLFKGDEFVVAANELIGDDKIFSAKMVSKAADKVSSVGTYSLSIAEISGYRTENYEIKTEANVMKVEPMPIVVTAKNMEKEYSEILNFTGNEFSTDRPTVNGDTISFVFLRSNGTTESAAIGEYDIMPSMATGAGSLNYAFSYQSGKLKVIPKPLKVKAQESEKVYGDKDPELKFAVTDRRGFEYQPSIFSGKMVRQPGENAGKYTINRGSLTPGSSYTFTFEESTFFIQKALPLINANLSNEGGQFMVADVVGVKNGSAPNGSIKMRVSENGAETTAAVNHGESKWTVEGLPDHMTTAEIEYLGDENYLPTKEIIPIYAIVYHTNGGLLTNAVTNFDGSEPIRLLTPAREQNYRFEGWYETEDFTGEPIRKIPVGTTHDIHLYAKWSTTYEDLSLVVLYNQLLAVANPLNRDFLNWSTYKWYKDGIQLDGYKQYFGFENQSYLPTGHYKVEIYYQNNAPIVLEMDHLAVIPKSKVYPNPVSKSTELNFVSELIKEKNIKVEVLNSRGQNAAEVKIERNADSYKIKGFGTNGTYIIRLIVDGKMKESHKVIVEK